MFKTKLFAIICSVASVVVAATTALTLVLSGPRDTHSLHMLSSNEAVSYGITNLFNGPSESIETITKIVDIMQNNKTSLKGNITINALSEEIVGGSIPSNIDLSNLGLSAGFSFDSDVENNVYSLLLDLSMASTTLANGTVYVDSDTFIAKVPALFEGILTAALNNLDSDINNSYIGKTLFANLNFEKLLQQITALISELKNASSSIEFDYEDFADGLMDTIESAYTEATKNMTTESLGKKQLTGGSYEAYLAKIPVEDLSYILRDAIVYVLTNEDFQELAKSLMSDMSSMLEDGMDELAGLSLMIGGADISSSLNATATMIKSGWGQFVTPVKQVLGENIEITLYLNDAVETAGFEFAFIGLEDGSISYDTSLANSEKNVIYVTGDYTGGKHIGDYSNISFTAKDSGNDMASYQVVSKNEENGDFSTSVTFTSNGRTMQITADGSNKTNGDYFDFKVDSYKIIMNDELFIDFGFSLSFSEIDNIEKPSGSPVYNIWDMNEDDFEVLFEEIDENLSALGDMFN